MIPIYIINFNTTELTNKCIQSIIDNIKSFDYQINIFDNSNIKKYDNIYFDKINIIDNTQGQIINFDKVLQQNANLAFYQNVKHLDKANHGSLKHTYTVDYLIYHTNENFLLIESDAIINKDIDFIDDQYITIAGVCYQQPMWKNRFLPFLQYFNVKKIKEYNLHYFDKNRISFGNHIQNSFLYDTGASFYEDIIMNKLPYKQIDYKVYAFHRGCGSWLSLNEGQQNKFKQIYDKGINFFK